MNNGTIKNYISIVSCTILSNMRFSRGILMLYCLSLGLNIVEFGLVQTIYSISRFIFEIPSGMISDIFKREKVLSLATFLSGMVYFIFNKWKTNKWGIIYINNTVFN